MPDAQAEVDFFALPPFDATAALADFLRQLRAIKGLRVRAEGSKPGADFTSKTVVTWSLTSETKAALRIKLARRLANSPEWDDYPIASSADLRKCADELRRRASRWADEP
jgi:hypothetical protein